MHFYLYNIMMDKFDDLRYDYYNKEQLTSNIATLVGTENTMRLCRIMHTK